MPRAIDECPLCGQTAEAISRCGKWVDGKTYDFICHCCCRSIEFFEDGTYRIRTQKEMEEFGWSGKDAGTARKSLAAVRKRLKR